MDKQDSTPAYKKCTMCGAEKPADLLHFSKKLHRLTSRCKNCISEIDKAYRASFTAEEIARRRSLGKQWKAENRDKVIAGSKRYYQNSRESHDAAQRKYYAKNKEAILEKNRRWFAANPDKAAEFVRRWDEKSRRNNPAYRIRKAVSGAVKRGGARKNGESWESLVGYSVERLIDHLCGKFMPGMTLENYGEWHIDHIKPIASFKIHSVQCEDFKACWALSNLQPLWALDNIRKGAKYESA